MSTLNTALDTPITTVPNQQYAQATQPPVYGQVAPMQQQAPVTSSLSVFRNKMTGNMMTLEDGRQVPEWLKDAKGNIQQDRILDANQIQVGDSVMITNMQQLCYSDPALMLNKLERFKAILPAGPGGVALTIAPISSAVPYQSLGGRRAHFSAKGTWIGFVAEQTMGKSLASI